MTEAQAYEVAERLRAVGVSKRGILDLVADHTYGEIMAQLDYLPYRRAKRPEAFVIEAIRQSYSPPKEFLHARPPSRPQHEGGVDEDPEPALRPPPAGTRGHRAPHPLGPAAQHDGLGSGGPYHELVVPDAGE